MTRPSLRAPAVLSIILNKGSLRAGGIISFARKSVERQQNRFEAGTVPRFNGVQRKSRSPISSCAHCCANAYIYRSLPGQDARLGLRSRAWGTTLESKENSIMSPRHQPRGAMRWQGRRPFFGNKMRRAKREQQVGVAVGGFFPPLLRMPIPNGHSPSLRDFQG